MAGARGLRVIAGKAGGLRLVVPKGQRTRPTADRVKESLFSALGDRVAGASVLDLYAGSGALGIEALSRGAASALLVDRDEGAAGVIRRNLATTRLGGHARVVRRSVEALLRGVPPPEAPFDLVFCDPPYDLPPEVAAGVVGRLAADAWTRPEALVVVERSTGSPRPTWPDGWGMTWERVSGDTLVALVSRLLP